MTNLRARMDNGLRRCPKGPAQEPRRNRRRRDASPIIPQPRPAPDLTPERRRQLQPSPNRKARRNKARATRRKLTRSNNTIKIFQQNVAGLKTREVELFKRLERLKIDIAVIQECNFPVSTNNKTEAVSHTIPEYRGWNVVASPRTTGRRECTHSKGKGGVAILVKEGINYEILKSRPVPSDDKTTEYVGIRIFPTDAANQAVDIHNLYVPPINSSSAEDDRVQNWNTSNLPNSENAFIFSDTNCHGSWDSRLKSSPMSDDWDNWMIENNFMALNSSDSYTRKSVKGELSSPDVTIAPVQWIGNTSWTAMTKQPGGSDHIPLLINIRLNKYAPNHEPKRSKKKRNQRTKWAFKKAKWAEYQERVVQNIGNWPETHVSWNTNKLNNALTHAILKAAEGTIPLGMRTKPKAFWNNDLENMSKTCDEARTKCHESAASANVYVEARKEFTKACSDAKTEAWHSFVENIDSRTNPSKIWNLIGGLDGRKSKSKPGVELREDERDEKPARTDNEKAKKFIQTYIKASTHEDNIKGREKKLAEKHVVHRMRDATKKCKSCNGEKTGMCAPITMDELDLGLRKIKTGKAAGLDRVSNELLKHLPPLGKQVLLRLMNSSWNIGVSPG